MDPRQPRPQCKWEGCHYSVASPASGAGAFSTEIYCALHRREHRQSRPLPVDKKQPLVPAPLSRPPLGLARNLATTEPVRRASGTSSPNSAPSIASGLSSPTNEKKQLPNKHIARKSTKQPPMLGQPHVAPATSPKRKLDKDASSAGLGTAKKPRLSTAPIGPSGLEHHSGSNRSSFSENGIPHPSKRDDFALRPKKKEATQSSGSKPNDDQRRSHRGSYHSSSSRPGPGLSRNPQSPRSPQTTTLNESKGGISSTSVVIDLTEDNDPEVPVSRPQRTPLPPTGAGGSSSGRQKRPGHPTAYQRNGVVVLKEEHSRNSPQHQPFPSTQNGRPAEQNSRSPKPEKPMERVRTIASPPTVPKPAGECSSKFVAIVPRPNTLLPKNGKDGISESINFTARQGSLASREFGIHQHQAPNGIHQFSVNEKNSAPFNSNLNPDLDPSELMYVTAKEKRKPVPQITPATDTGKKLHSQVNGGHVSRQVNGKEPTTKDKERVATPATHPPPSVSLPAPSPALTSTPAPAPTPTPTPTPAPAPAAPPTSAPSLTPASVPAHVSSKPPSTGAGAGTRGPLSALLRGREWKKMTPEERRLFWVSQHDPIKFDAQIYSENNRPFRPGDPLFGLPEDEQPPRPTCPATHFDYLDPRVHYSFQRPDTWYQKKQAEISACGNRKKNLGKVLGRVANRRRDAPQLSEHQRLQSLPHRVRENPQWLAALGVLEDLEAQARDKRASEAVRKRKAKETAKATIHAERDIDADIESS